MGSVSASLLALTILAANPFADWHLGSFGHDKAMKEQRSSKAPMIVYFRTDWCGYCARLDKGLLSRMDLQDALGPAAKVMINPEKSRANQRLAQQYGVRGYPSIYVRASNGELSKMRTHVRKNGTWVLMSPEQFVAAVEQIGGAIPKPKEKKNADTDALAALQKRGKHGLVVTKTTAALRSDPANPTLYFLRGMSNWKLGNTTQARRDFEVAIVLRDDYEDAKKALGALTKSSDAEP